MDAAWGTKPPLPVNPVNMSEADVYRAIVSDFESAWQALAESEGDMFSGRGNLMFARQAMALLEWASRLTCPDAKPNGEHAAMSKALFEIEPRYFLELPGPVPQLQEEPDRKSVV